MFSSVKSAYSPNEYKPLLVRSAAPCLSGRSQERKSTKHLTSRSQSSFSGESRRNFLQLFHRDQIHNRRSHQEYVNESVNYNRRVNSISSPTSELFHTNLKSNPEKNSVRLPNLSSRALTCCTKELCVRIPPFVQLGTLRPGQCFVSKQWVNRETS